MCKAIESLYINTKLTMPIEYGCGVVLNPKSVYILKQYYVYISLYKAEGAQVNVVMVLVKTMP